MEHRGDIRIAATFAAAPGFVSGQHAVADEFDATAHLKAIRANPLVLDGSSDAPRVLHISVNRYKSFPARIFHAMCLKDRVNSHALFFKNNFTNHHLPIFEHELDLAVDIVRSLLKRLQKTHDAILGFAVTVLAKVRYSQTFQHRRALVWGRRIYLELRLILRGDLATLWQRVAYVLKKVQYHQSHTGRLSAR